MILLKDGVKYLDYEYGSEEELAQIVIEHYKEIFGTNALYFDPQTMKTHIGITARNDGVILAPDQKQWFLLEVELAQHSLHKHIIPQITKFNIAYQQLETRRKLAYAISELIRQDPYKIAIMQTYKIEDIHQHLTETIETPPTIAIVIDQKSPELEAVCKNLPFKTKATEFKTFTRENTGMNVHLHQFTPLYEKPAIPKSLLNILTTLEQIYEKRKSYDEAVKIAAKKLKLYERTIRHDCTTDIGLTSKQFRKLLEEKEKLRALIIEKFQDYEDAVREVIS